MKHVKTFEDNTHKYKIDDIVIYNNTVSIIKNINYYNRMYNYKGEEMRVIDEAPLKLYEFDADDNLVFRVYTNERYVKPASKKEKNDFNLKLTMIKYNL